MKFTLVYLFGVAACAFVQVGANADNANYANKPVLPFNANNKDVRLRGPSADPDLIGGVLGDLNVLLTFEENCQKLLNAVLCSSLGDQNKLILYLRACLSVDIALGADLTTIIELKPDTYIGLLVKLKVIIEVKFNIAIDKIDFKAWIEANLGLIVGIGVDVLSLAEGQCGCKDGIPTTTSTGSSSTSTTPCPTQSTQSTTCSCA